MMTDPVADMLTRVRNAVMVAHPAVSIPSSKMKEAIAGILASEGFVDSFDVQPKGPGRELTIRIRRVSKPGHRVYRSSSELPRAQGGLGVVIVSTSQGLLTDREARRRRLGGEIICEVW
jgi:small subunit ribosomal protein S8